VAVGAEELEALRQLRLEEIVNTEVTSVSKRPEPLFQAAAAAFVLSSDDIRRSGATTIADALRMVPGLGVAKANAHTWTITSRGFNSQFADKLLVLVDGRSVFSPVSNGVNWEALDYLLEDLDRIEVVRGPGGTLWGANAVNGVINIITKSAEDTQGLYATAGGGTYERAFGGGRYGTRLGEHGFLRAYAQYHDRSHYPDGIDDWNLGQGGFRADWPVGPNQFTLQGDYYYGTGDNVLVVPSYTPPYTPSFSEHVTRRGGNVLGRFERSFSEDSELQLQLYYDRADHLHNLFGEINSSEKFDVELKHRFSLPANQNLTYGVGYRFLPTTTADSGTILKWSPHDRNQQLVSAFIQDEIALAPDRVRLTFGTKLEHNDYTGWEVQPNVRMSWTPTERQTAWAAVSRAVATPARSRDITENLYAIGPVGVIGSDPVFLRGRGNADSPSEVVVSYELGYRIQPVENLAFDVATFFNQYDQLVRGAAGPFYYEVLPAPHWIQETTGVNDAAGDTYGVEISVQWRPLDWWRLSAWYTYFETDFEVTPFPLGSDPRNQAFLRSSLDLPGHFELDLLGRFVDQLPSGQVDAYAELDARLAWRPTKHLELAVVGQNLIHSQHDELAGNPVVGSQVTPLPRSVYLQLSLRY